MTWWSRSGSVVLPLLGLLGLAFAGRASVVEAAASALLAWPAAVLWADLRRRTRLGRGLEAGRLRAAAAAGR